MVIIKTIILDKLDSVVIRSHTDLHSFIGIDVIKNKDIHGVEYELKNNEQKYFLVKNFGEISIFASEGHLLELLLGEYIDEIESSDIYDHGYPESRLIPPNHHEQCQENFLENVVSDITEKVTDIIEGYF